MDSVTWTLCPHPDCEQTATAQYDTSAYDTEGYEIPMARVTCLMGHTHLTPFEKLRGEDT